MSAVDRAMSERCSKLIMSAFESDEVPAKEVQKNFRISIANMIRNRDRPGPNFERLYQYLNAIYSYSDKFDVPGFGYGAIYGSLKVYDEFAKKG